MSQLQQFAGPRLPLGAPVHYAGLQCRVVGRAFGRELYDLQATASPGLRHIFANVELRAITVDFARLGHGPGPGLES